MAAILPTASCASGATFYDPGTMTGASLTTSSGCELYAGNDKNDVGPATTDAQPFGITDWTLLWSSDDGQEAGQPDFGLTGDFVGPDGTWNVASFLGYTQIMIILKAGNEYAAYLIDATSLSGLWTTAGILTNNAGAPRDISHISVYFAGDPSAVPLPAAFFLFLTGMSVFAGIRKRA
ncbi:MAG: VPLPA-CTERM sorting domain-containing protein [Parvularculaceae bacterium]